MAPNRTLSAMPAPAPHQTAGEGGRGRFYRVSRPAAAGLAAAAAQPALMQAAAGSWELKVIDTGDCTPSPPGSPGFSNPLTLPLHLRHHAVHALQQHRNDDRRLQRLAQEDEERDDGEVVLGGGRWIQGVGRGGGRLSAAAGARAGLWLGGPRSRGAEPPAAAAAPRGAGPRVAAPIRVLGVPGCTWNAMAAALRPRATGEGRENCGRVANAPQGGPLPPLPLLLESYVAPETPRAVRPWVRTRWGLGDRRAGRVRAAQEARLLVTGPWVAV
jgi:hypothetical protein